MKCKRCESTRIALVNAKCSDLCWVMLGNKEHDGYVPRDMGICAGDNDYVGFKWCLDCGQIQDKFPVKKTELEKGMANGD